MALGKRRDVQQELWIATGDLPKSPGHPFYAKLNEVLSEGKFDHWVEELCRVHYAKHQGRPSIPPGVYFRMLLVGYFEGLDSQRGIAWRCRDSRSLCAFLGLGPTEESPEHSSLTRVRKRLPMEVHEEVFAFALKLAEQKDLLKGKTIAVDSTTLEANAAMKSIVRKDTGGARRSWLKGLIDVSKRYLIQVAARNLGLLMRKLFGIGTPKGFQGPSEALRGFLFALWTWRMAMIEQAADGCGSEVGDSLDDSPIHALTLAG